MQPSPDRQRFRRNLLRWYAHAKRSLPWRDDRDPYRVWVSEVMLQQTRAAVVTEYFPRFLARFPTVRHLARARESSVLAAWSGLGYYRRARALRLAARMMVRERRGEFPRTATQLQSLPGIGRYTAAAVASIAFGEPVAVVDGNVERLIARIFGRKLSGEALWAAAGDLLDGRHPGDFNQAMMELGATICLPREPLCAACPVVNQCATRGASTRSPGADRRKGELRYALALTAGDKKVRLVRRDADASLMAGMWELPAVESAGGEVVFRLKHSITTTDYRVAVHRGTGRERGEWVDRARLPRLALTGITRKALRRAGLRL
jgi:A/G-specific adenine glycosylase